MLPWGEPSKVAMVLEAARTWTRTKEEHPCQRGPCSQRCCPSLWLSSWEDTEPDKLVPSPPGVSCWKKRKAGSLVPSRSRVGVGLVSHEEISPNPDNMSPEHLSGKWSQGNGDGPNLTAARTAHPRMPPAFYLNLNFLSGF